MGIFSLIEIWYMNLFFSHYCVSFFLVFSFHVEMQVNREKQWVLTYLFFLFSYPKLRSNILPLTYQRIHWNPLEKFHSMWYRQLCTTLCLLSKMRKVKLSNQTIMNMPRIILTIFSVIKTLMSNASFYFLSDESYKW